MYLCIYLNTELEEKYRKKDMYKDFMLVKVD